MTKYITSFSLSDGLRSAIVDTLRLFIFLYVILNLHIPKLVVSGAEIDILSNIYFLRYLFLLLCFYGFYLSLRAIKEYLIFAEAQEKESLQIVNKGDDTDNTHVVESVTPSGGSNRHVLQDDGVRTVRRNKIDKQILMLAGLRSLLNSLVTIFDLTLPLILTFASGYLFLKLSRK